MKLSQFTVGDTIVRFDKDEIGGPQLSLLPKGLGPVKHREFLPPDVEIRGLPAKWQRVRAYSLDPLVHLKLREENPPGSFAQGRTMRRSPSTAGLVFLDQKVFKNDGRTSVVTALNHPLGLLVEHHLSWQGNTPVFTSQVRVRNKGKNPLTLEFLTSFSLGGLTPFAADDAPNRLTVHRFRSAWSAEGRRDSQTIEDLNLERSWIGCSALSERFGQVGSMPVRGFFPFVALEDREAGVLWGARLACAGSWEMELFRNDDFVCLSGGLAGREFGHWFKTLATGEDFQTPPATLACLQGDLDQLAQRLSSAQEGPLANLPKIENGLPIVVNEWCTSWGNPTQENLVALAKRLHGTPAKYLVIDDGWAERPGNGIQQNGDWITNRKSFPDGLAAACQAIRAEGLIPGIWFEFEVCNPGSKAFDITDHHLQRDGRVLQVGSRRFWDFRDPFTFDYLTKKVIHLLRDNGFGYLKVDYNDTIGYGVDGAESPGEGLRQHIEGVQKFFRKLREELPDLVIENCSSGGHRLEPSMMALCAMGSFSDAHETREIPIIAANLQRLILPRQSQVWAVLRKADTAQRLAYSLAACFLGRMCLSGEVHDLSPAQWKLAVSAMELYRRVHPLIRDGHSTFHGETGKSWRHPQGWQAVLRVSQNGNRALLVAHTFGKPFPKSVAIPLPDAGWKVEESWPTKAGLQGVLKGKTLHLDLTGDFCATILSLHNPIRRHRAHGQNLIGL
jgi:alpha-galactosidase